MCYMVSAIPLAGVDLGGSFTSVAPPRQCDAVDAKVHTNTYPDRNATTGSATISGGGSVPRYAGR